MTEEKYQILEKCSNINIRKYMKKGKNRFH